MNPQIEWVLKRPRYQRVLMLVGVLALIAGLFYWLVLKPQQELYVAKNKAKDALHTKLLADRAIAADFPAFQAEAVELETKLKKAQQLLPTGREIPNLLTTISSRAKESGLKVLSFRPGDETMQEFYAEVPVGLKLEGTFHQLANFFYNVGTLPRIVNINNVKIGMKSAQDSNTAILSVDCLATTFRFLENSTANGGGK